MSEKALTIGTEAALLKATDCFSMEVAQLAVAAGSADVDAHQEELHRRTNGLYRALHDVIRNGEKSRLSSRLYSWRPKVRRWPCSSP